MPCRRQQIDSQRGENAAGQRTAGDVVIAAVEQGDGDQRAGVSPMLKPITSGLPSGLRIIDWKMAPLMPSAPPNSSAMAIRGKRHWVTTVTRFFGASPLSAAKTCSRESCSVP